MPAFHHYPPHKRRPGRQRYRPRTDTRIKVESNPARVVPVPSKIIK